MISQQARQGVEFIFMKAANACLVRNPGDSCVVTPVTGSNVDEFPERTIVVLTISSFLFRLITIFHINENPANTDYFTRGTAGKTLIEVLSEIGNLCCGAMNRDLLHHFPHLGISTPYVLDSKCMAFLSELKPGHVSSYEITINHTVQMHVSLCLCEYAPIDFAVDMTIAREETGELEMF